MKRLSIVFSLFLLFFFIFTPTTDAHPGNTASDGCHYCRTNCGSWGVPWNQRHCHDGYAPAPAVYYDPTATPTPIIIPETLSGSHSFHYDKATKTYNVNFNWDDWAVSDGWSVGISSYAGGDPGNIADTDQSQWTFKKVYPGRKYINVKGLVNGYWSRVSYWTIDVPALPTLTPTPTSTPTPTKTPAPTRTPTPRPTNTLAPTKSVIPTIAPLVEDSSYQDSESAPEISPSRNKSVMKKLFKWLID